MDNLSQLLVGGIPLVIVIFGLVEFAKSFGLQGKLVTLLSMLLGVIFGICYKIAAAGLPAGFAGWFIVVVFGLALGLVTSGFYKFIDNRMPVQGP